MEYKIISYVREYIHQWDMDLFRRDIPKENKIALFDLDNTLIVGDIGDAVFAQLLLLGLKSHISWKQYKKLSVQNPQLAYVEIVKAMSGLESEYILQLTRNVTKSNSEYLFIGGDKIKIPKPNPILQEMLKMLKSLGFKIYIISASNDISAKVIGSIFFHISPEFIFGIKSIVKNGKLTDQIMEPLPIGSGKLELYHILNGNRLPFIVASDNELDLPLFTLCDAGGIALVVGGNKSLTKKVKKVVKPNVQIINIPA